MPPFWLRGPQQGGSVNGPAGGAVQQPATGGVQMQGATASPQLLGQLLRGSQAQGQGTAPQASGAPMAQGADPFAAARAAVAQHMGQPLAQGGGTPGGMGSPQGAQFGALDPSTLSAGAQTGLDNLCQMVGRKSDRRLKSDVVRVGRLPNGLPVYAYRLEGSPLFEVGCMADEVALLHPSAVWEAEDGFLRVRYDLAVL